MIKTSLLFSNIVSSLYFRRIRFPNYLSVDERVWARSRVTGQAHQGITVGLFY